MHPCSLLGCKAHVFKSQDSEHANTTPPLASDCQSCPPNPPVTPARKCSIWTCPAGPCINLAQPKAERWDSRQLPVTGP
eukprot:14937802-Alexandrium_andersonii.AAC.1